MITLPVAGSLNWDVPLNQALLDLQNLVGGGGGTIPTNIQQQLDAINLTASGKNRVFRQATMPTGGPFAVGDLWFDTANNNKPYAWDGTTWVNNTDGTIALASQVVGKSTVFWQATAPAATGRSDGDTWFDTSNGNAIYRWSAGAWVAGVLGTQVIAAGAITATQIADGSITTPKIATDSITANQIAANAITSSELAANAVIAGKIAAGTITAQDIHAGTITAAQIAAGTITSASGVIGNLDAGAITTGTLAAARIAANSITAAQISTAIINASNRLVIGLEGGVTVNKGGTGLIINSVGSAGQDIAVSYAGVSYFYTARGYTYTSGTLNVAGAVYIQPDGTIQGGSAVNVARVVGNDFLVGPDRSGNVNAGSGFVHIATSYQLTAIPAPTTYAGYAPMTFDPFARKLWIWGAGVSGKYTAAWVGITLS